MSNLCMAMLLQHSDLYVTNRLLMVLIGIIAVVLIALGIVLLVFAVKAMQAIKEFGAAAEEFKNKALPLLDVVADVSRTGRDLLTDAAPKIKVMTTNFVDASETLKATGRTAKSVVERCDATIADANLRAQRQVARVDGMVTATLNTTTEVVVAIAQGLKAPAQRIAVLAGQARGFAESFMAKLRARRAPAESPIDDVEEPPYV